MWLPQPQQTTKSINLLSPQLYTSHVSATTWRRTVVIDPKIYEKSISFRSSRDIVSSSILLTRIANIHHHSLEYIVKKEFYWKALLTQMVAHTKCLRCCLSRLRLYLASMPMTCREAWLQTRASSPITPNSWSPELTKEFTFVRIWC